MNSAATNLQRRLAAVLVADVVAYSTHMAMDEEGTFALIKTLMREQIGPKIRQYNGRVVKTNGDGLVAEFHSALESVKFAIDLQETIARKASGSSAPEMQLRIGINYGDIIIDTDGDVFGDGVNVAARLEQIASPGGICISGKVHEEIRNKLSIAFDPWGEQQLKNIPHSVAVYSLFQQPKPKAAGPAEGKSKPSLLVRPFIGVGDLQTYFTDGFTNDVVTELTRFTQLKVVSYHTANRLKLVETPDLAVEHDIDFVIEGSIRRLGKRMRISCELADTVSGECLWAERFDLDEQEIFSVQDELAGTIVGRVIGRVKAAEAEKARHKPPANLAAYECVLRGNALPMGDTAAEAQARQLYERAIELDPLYGRAYAKLAHYKQLEWFRDAGDSNDLLDEAHAIAKKSVALSPNDPVCMNILGWILLHRREFDVAAKFYSRALELNPNDPEQVSYFGTYCSFAGEPERALQWFERAQVLDPLYEPAWYWPFRGVAEFVLRRFDQAIVGLSRSPTMPVWVNVYLAAANAYLGNTAAASMFAKDVLAQSPAFSARRFAAKEPYRLEEDLDTLLNGMLQAGLPE